MISEQELRDEAERQSDSRLNGYDVSAFIRGARFLCERLKMSDAIQRSEVACTRLDCSCVHRGKNYKCGLLKCIYI